VDKNSVQSILPEGGLWVWIGYKLFLKIVAFPFDETFLSLSTIDLGRIFQN